MASGGGSRCAHCLPRGGGRCRPHCGPVSHCPEQAWGRPGLSIARTGEESCVRAAARPPSLGCLVAPGPRDAVEGERSKAQSRLDGENGQPCAPPELGPQAPTQVVLWLTGWQGDGRGLRAVDRSASSAWSPRSVTSSRRGLRIKVTLFWGLCGSSREGQWLHGRPSEESPVATWGRP